MYKLVVLACAIASAAAVADPSLAYANGLTYGAAYTNIAAAPIATTAYAAAPIAAAAPLAATYAAAPVAAAAYAAPAPVASSYALPPVRTIQEAPIVEQYVEPVEQWGYKVAY